MTRKYSLSKTRRRLKVDFPDQPEMQVFTEPIYQSLYMQSRSALEYALTRGLSKLDPGPVWPLTRR